MNTITKTALTGMAMLGLSVGAMNTAEAKDPIKVSAAIGLSNNDRTDGHYETVYETVIVEPARYETRYNPYTRRYEQVYVPARYETVARQVWVNDAPTFRFGFGFGGWGRDHRYHHHHHHHHGSHSGGSHGGGSHGGGSHGGGSHGGSGSHGHRR